MLNFVDLFSKVPPNKMLGHFTLHWRSVKKCWKKMEKLCTTSVRINLIASTQGICIIRVLVTTWCSNNSPSMKCTHVQFWYPDTIWSPLLQYSVVLAASLFVVCVVLSRNCYACFTVLSFWFVFCWMFLGFCLRMFECLCIQCVCPFCSVALFPWSTIS